MAKKKSPTPKKQAVETARHIENAKTDREEKIMNCIANTSVILMSTMMGAFTEIMLKTTEAMTTGMAEALGGKEAGEKAIENVKQELPSIDEKMKSLISNARKDIYKQLKQKSKEIKPLISDPAFGVGPKIVEKYEFKLPRLTEELDDNSLAQYAKLLVSEDPSFAEMFKELISWLNSLPNPPEKTTP